MEEKKKEKAVPFRRSIVSVAAMSSLHFPQNLKTQHTQHERCRSTIPSVTTDKAPQSQRVVEPIRLVTWLV